MTAVVVVPVVVARAGVAVLSSTRCGAFVGGMISVSASESGLSGPAVVAATVVVPTVVVVSAVVPVTVGVAVSAAAARTSVSALSSTRCGVFVGRTNPAWASA